LFFRTFFKFSVPERKNIFHLYIYYIISAPDHFFIPITVEYLHLRFSSLLKPDAVAGIRESSKSPSDVITTSPKSFLIFLFSVGTFHTLIYHRIKFYPKPLCFFNCFFTTFTNFMNIS
jgi:hypothetical protein